MEQTFLTELDIRKVRHLRDITIPLSQTERKNLILTGKNGSGKTSVLNELVECLKDTVVIQMMELHMIDPLDVQEFTRSWKFDCSVKYTSKEQVQKNIRMVNLFWLFIVMIEGSILLHIKISRKLI